jgi:RNA recognition motif-containing protein
VEILNPPPKITEDDVRKFMEQFGKVVEVAAVRDFDESIHLSKRIYDL